jgi:hypothetical protein
MSERRRPVPQRRVVVSGVGYRLQDRQADLFPRFTLQPWIEHLTDIGDLDAHY